MTNLTPFKKSAVALGLSAVAVLGLSACADEMGPRHYSPYEQGQIAQVDTGTVVSFRPIEFGNGNTGTGTVVGGLAGAGVGAAVAGRRDRGAGAVIGGLGGALLGNAIAKGQRTSGYAYTVRRDRDGSLFEVPQADPQPIPNGVRVNIVYEGGRARIVPSDGGQYYAPPPPPRY